MTVFSMERRPSGSSSLLGFFFLLTGLFLSYGFALCGRETRLVLTGPEVVPGGFVEFSNVICCILICVFDLKERLVLCEIVFLSFTLFSEWVVGQSVLGCCCFEVS